MPLVSADLRMRFAAAILAILFCPSCQQSREGTQASVSLAYHLPRPCAANSPTAAIDRVTSDTALFANTALAGPIAALYSRDLRGVDEPVLCSEPGVERYRFHWTRSFHPVITVRLERGQDSAVVVAKQVATSRGDGTLIPGRDTLLRLPSSDLTEFDRLFAASDFWTLETQEVLPPNVIQLDGAGWLLEVAFPERYHIVERWSPASDSREAGVRQLCLYLLDLAGFMPPDDEVY
jgi:hypothetical protein